MTAAEKRELARLEKRAKLCQETFERRDRWARAAAESMAEADDELYQLKVRLGLLRLPNTAGTVRMANTEYIYRKLYPRPR